MNTIDFGILWQKEEKATTLTHWFCTIIELDHKDLSRDIIGEQAVNVWVTHQVTNVSGSRWRCHIVIHCPMEWHSLQYLSTFLHLKLRCHVCEWHGIQCICYSIPLCIWSHCNGWGRKGIFLCWCTYCTIYPLYMGANISYLDIS